MPVFKPRNTIRARELRNAATPAERLLWRYLSHARLGAKFSRQMPVGPFFADFLCRERKLIVELDGFSHDIDPGRDVARDRYLRAAGYRVLHFPNAEVLANVEGVITTIRLALGNLPTPGPSRKREGSYTAADRNATS
jgi:BirA family biotin operon repressor/biotin-[acetyl-CoA-carboxylase] ligase